MRLISYQSSTGPRVAGLRDGQAVDLNQADPKVPRCIKALLAQGPEGLARAERAIRCGTVVPMSSLKLLPPVPRPEKVICVGLNYVDHARETGMALPSEPVIFTKFVSAVLAPHAPIVIPAVSDEVDYEGELVLVIGRGGRSIALQEARSHVAGYCCGNDVSARDWQLRKPGGQWLLGKSFDTFAPFGPTLVTADEVPNPDNLSLQTRVNGQVKQNSSTAQFIFKVDELVSYISQVCTLVPGDIIFTGTPSGVGMGSKPPVYLQPGDTVEVEIETLGVLCNPVIRQG